VKQGFKRLSKQDKKGIGTRLIEEMDLGALWKNWTIRFSQRKHMLKILSKVDSRHFLDMM
jgi:hypothetical protein